MSLQDTEAGTIDEILSAGSDSIEPIPFTNGATVDVYDYAGDNVVG